MGICTSAILVGLSSLADKLRGSAEPKGWGGAKKVVAGGVLGLCLGLTGLPLLAATALMALQFSIGWGGPLGSLLEGDHTKVTRLQWWQVGPLKKDARLAMLVRGMMSGLIVAPLGFILGPQILWLIPFFGKAYMASPMIAHEIDFRLRKHTGTGLADSWQTQEYIRGALLAISCLMV